MNTSFHSTQSLLKTQKKRIFLLPIVFKNIGPSHNVELAGKCNDEAPHSLNRSVVNVGL